MASASIFADVSCLLSRWKVWMTKGSVEPAIILNKYGLFVSPKPSMGMQMADGR